MDQSVFIFDILVTRTSNGGCSAFLFESVGTEFSFALHTSSKFRIPKDVTIPLVVIAAGSGLGTYLPMLINDNIPNPKYAFLAFRTENTVPHLGSHLTKAVNYGKLNLFVELSREVTTLTTSKRKLLRKETKKRYIDQLLLQEAELIRELATPVEEGGLGAYFYVCGTNHFFSTVRRSLGQISSGMVAGLVSSARLHLEVQARGTRNDQASKPPVKLTEMCFHSKMTDYWTAINGVVYDITTYLSWHPGGRKILHYVAGTDCSKYWGIVSHDQDRMIYTQLSAYEVGPYDQSDSSGLNMYLELVTRMENCVNDTFCDSYGRIQNLTEGVFGREFLGLAVLFLADGKIDRKQLGLVLRRIWSVKNGEERAIANKMYNIRPDEQRASPTSLRLRIPTETKQLEMRAVNSEEKMKLRSRLIDGCSNFFLRLKKAIVDVIFNEDAGKQEGTPSGCPPYERMFFRMVLALEEFYSSLAAPLPLDTVRCWDIVRTELFSRKTFLLRFNRERTTIMVAPKQFATLESAGPPAGETEKESYIDELLDLFEVDKSPVYCMDSDLSASLIYKWFGSG
jgi:ferredoxin-NADP reductase/predicted heme/steroid binding protein